MRESIGRGGEGIDTLDFSAFATGVNVDLGQIGLVQTVIPNELHFLFPEEDIENLIGG